MNLKIYSKHLKKSYHCSLKKALLKALALQKQENPIAHKALYQLLKLSIDSISVNGSLNKEPMMKD